MPKMIYWNGNSFENLQDTNATTLNGKTSNDFVSKTGDNISGELKALTFKKTDGVEVAYKNEMIKTTVSPTQPINNKVGDTWFDISIN